VSIEAPACPRMLMARRRCTLVPLIDDGELIGVLSHMS